MIAVRVPFIHSISQSHSLPLHVYPLSQGDYAQAAPLYRRAVEAKHPSLRHPNLGKALNNWALSLKKAVSVVMAF